MEQELLLPFLEKQPASDYTTNPYYASMEYVVDHFETAGLGINEKYVKEFNAHGFYQFINLRKQIMFCSPNILQSLNVKMSYLFEKRFTDLFSRTKFVDNRILEIFEESIAKRSNFVDLSVVPAHKVMFNGYDAEFDIQFRSAYGVSDLKSGKVLGYLVQFFVL